MDNGQLDQRLQQVLEFPLVSGIFGRRSRRFGFGMSIPDGPLAYTSPHDPLPLCDMACITRCLRLQPITFVEAALQVESEGGNAF